MGYRHTKGIYLDDQQVAPTSILETTTTQEQPVISEPVVTDEILVTTTNNTETETKEVQNALKILEPIQPESNSVSTDITIKETKEKPNNKKKVVAKKKKTS